jgi:peptide/nickel transport system substrate-binding protein
VRKLLSQAIDRDALIAALGVPNLQGRVTLLEPGLDGIGDIAAPAWSTIKLADRREQLGAAAKREFGNLSRPTVRVSIPVGPGGDILFQRLQRDWGAIGLEVQRTPTPASADFVLIDLVAPSPSPAWFLRYFRCGAVRICADGTEELLDAARLSLVPAQRSALFAQVAGIMDDKALFIPLTAPVRWSLVGTRIGNFTGNRYARHSLMGLEAAPSARE